MPFIAATKGRRDSASHRVDGHTQRKTSAVGRNAEQQRLPHNKKKAALGWARPLSFMGYNREI